MHEILRILTSVVVRDVHMRTDHCTLLSLLSGSSDDLVFLFLDAFSPVCEQWGFGTVEGGLSFIPYVSPILVDPHSISDAATYGVLI